MDVLAQYSVQVYREEDGEGFVAVCPELPSLSAFGDSRQEAIEELQVVLELAIDTYRDEGWPLPDPKRAPSTSLPSGEFRARLPKTMHLQLAKRAEEEGVSQNALVVSYVAQGLGRDESQQILRETLARNLTTHLGATQGYFAALMSVALLASSGQEFSIEPAASKQAQGMSAASAASTSRDFALAGGSRRAHA